MKTTALLTLLAVLTPATLALTGGDQDGLRRVYPDRVPAAEREGAGGQVGDGKASGDAQADAKASASGQDTRTSTSTRRVVVVNGETIVDESTRDGKPTRGPATRRGRAGLGDAADLLRDLERDAPDLERLLREARDGKKVTDHSASSHKRRVVVINGETVVDEEWIDGKQVRGGKGRRGGGAPPARGRDPFEGLDLDGLLDGAGLPGDLEKQLRQGMKDAQRSSSTHRVVVVNGEKIVDERTRDGKPVKPGKGERAPRRVPTADLDELLDGLPEDLRKRALEEQHDRRERERKSGATRGKKPREGDGFRRVPRKPARKD